ncbi:MAG: hypothetical protein KatS3mg060_3064 [Dehalococcoidia bacterium]|nr:MAG: hypothetical protein KatS3mg060_3064 [Dehalococcoidia bacterium]
MPSPTDRPSPSGSADEIELLRAQLAEAERRIAAVEAQYRAIMDSVDDVIYTLDREQRFTGLYGRGVERRGIRVGALLGRRLRDFGDDPMVAAHEAAYERVLAGETAVVEGPPAAMPDVGRWVRDTISPLYDADGAIIGVVGISREMSAEREAERARQELVAAEARLEGVNLAAREMVHLINNDITAAVAAFELLLLDQTLGSHQRDLVRHALNGLQLASQHIRQFQQVVRVKTKPLSGSPALDLEQSAEVGE